MPATAPKAEIGYAQSVNYNWWLYDNETTPELIWPQSVYVYDQMRRTDAQVASVLRAVTLPVRRTPWRIDPAGARARVVKFVADDLGLPIVGKNPTAPARLKDRFSWPEHLRQALLMLVFGHMFFEQVYRVDDNGSAAHLRKLAPRPPKTIERVEVAPDGGLISISQYWMRTDTQPTPIPVDRLVAYVHDREGGNWLGNSLLRPAYKHWLIKDRLLRVQAQTVERNGMGIPLYKAQDGASEGDLTAGKNMATAWRAGEAAGSAVPFGADLVLRGVEGTLPDADTPIRYHDEQIARAVLAHFLNLGTQTGSWALGSTFADFFTLSLQTLAQQIADTATQHVIEDLVDINFGENEPAPRLVFDEIGSRQAATAEALKALVDAGVIHPDEVLEETSRQQYGLPPADPATATTPPPASSAAPQPVPPPAGAGEGLPKEPAAPVAVEARFNPDQVRIPSGHGGGEWSATGAIKDALKLGEKADLAPGEKLVGSDKVPGDSGIVRIALVDHGGHHSVRLGIGGPNFGGRGDEAGPWRAGPDRTAALNAERKKLRDEEASLGKEWDRLAADPHADPSRKAAVDKRLEELDTAGTSEIHPDGYTASLDQASAQRLQAALSAALEAGAKLQAQVDADQGPPRPDNGHGYWTLAEGSVSGEWADVHYNVYLDDPSSGVEVLLGAAPHGSGLDVHDLTDNEQGARLDSAEARRLVRLLGRYTSGVAAAGGMDTHPGGEQLRHYWVYGEGAAKWSTWTELRDHLLKYLNPEMAKRTAAEWFHLRYGFWPGADVNRVKHGKPPRGHLVGPG